MTWFTVSHKSEPISLELGMPSEMLHPQAAVPEKNGTPRVGGSTSEIAAASANKDETGGAGSSAADPRALQEDSHLHFITMRHVRIFWMVIKHVSIASHDPNMSEFG